MSRGIRAAGIAAFREPVSRELDLVERELARLLPHGNGLIRDVTVHLLSAKGKRLRPTLVLLTAEVAGSSSRADRVTAAAVVELIHLATLVHDDAIDGSHLRRGMPTVNKLWSDCVSILAGDYVYSKVFNVLAEAKMFGAMGVLARSTNEMTVGEMMQVEKKTDLGTTESDYMSIIDGKTASLIAAACEIGAMIGGCHDGEAEAFASFGRQLGLAFQIGDDILDIVEDDAALGKPRGTDLREGNVTLPMIAALRSADARGGSRMRNLALSLHDGRAGVPPMDSKSREALLNELVRLVEENGGLNYARAKAGLCARRAKDHLAELPDSPAKDALLLAADYVACRGLGPVLKIQ
jgi:octaprenyl-diphosphate synthase